MHKHYTISKKRMFSSALGISMLTLVGYLGFFARDIMMVRWFGAGDDVDVFFLGSMIPMFLVAVLSMPAGTAIIPIYAALRNATDHVASIRLACATAFLLTLFMVVLSVLLYSAAPFVFSVLNWQYSAEKLAAIHAVMNIYLIIMLLGGLIITANAVLNAEGRLVFPAVAQLVVPCVVVLALLVFGKSHGIYTAIYSMLFGQLVNLALVIYLLYVKGLLASFRIELNSVIKYFPFHQYAVLIAAALSTALIIPLSNIIAAQMPSGSVTTIGIGIKVILLISGVIGTGLTTVLLPYFSNLVAKSNHLKAQSDLSLFLLLATFICVPTALILRLLAGPIISLMVTNSALSDDNIADLIRTTQYGVAQLPFFTCSLIAIKYITAYRRVNIILITSLSGLILTYFLGMFFTERIGVSGISLAVTVSMAVSTVILIIYASYLKHLPISDSIFLVMNWIIFAAMYIGLHYHMILVLMVFGVIFILMGVGNWKKLIAEWRENDEPKLTATR